MSKLDNKTKDFKKVLVNGFDKVTSITISTKNLPVSLHLCEDGGFMINGDVFIDIMFRDPDRTRDRLISYAPIGEGGDENE